MASIDRYRPPREGYQPPTLPPAARRDRPSRSPVRQREVPPPAPSPPTHTSRTSPPRPYSRPGLQSPPRQIPVEEPPETSRAMPSQWLFTLDEVRSSPSILDGLSYAEEKMRRVKGINFLYQAGILLDLPQITLWVGAVFFHRFFMRHSMVEEKGGIHHYNIAATALFLANKTEENCRKTRDIIVAVAKVAQKNSKLVIDEQSKEYWRWRDSILTYEELMLELLTFDLTVEDPYNLFFGLLGELDLQHNKALRQSAWSFCNDAAMTEIPLLLTSHDVAVAAIFFASVYSRQPIDDVNGEPWWKFARANEALAIKAVDIMYEFYTENPLRRQNQPVLSPPFRLDNTRRQGDAVMMSQTETVSSAAPTPLDLNHGTQSPKTKTSSGTERGDAAWDPPPKRPLRDATPKGQPSNGLSPPGKRKEAHDDGESDGGGETKKSRLSVVEEGQMVES